MGPGFDCLLVLSDRTSSQQCLVMMSLLVTATKGFVLTLAQAEVAKRIPQSLQVSPWMKLTWGGGGLRTMIHNEMKRHDLCDPAFSPLGLSRYFQVDVL